jgi:hypothetical protein
MATQRPFKAPTTFTPRFTGEGMLERSRAQTTRDAQAAAARIKGTAQTPGGINPLAAIGSLFNPLSVPGSILALTQLEGSSPPQDTPQRRQAMANYAVKTNMWGKYGAEKEPFKVPSMEEPEPDTTALSSASTPSERAYLEEKRRATQLAEQDQLSKKYKVADLTKAYNTAATPEEKEKIGLQIWATTNPRLAERLKPGQLGYTEAQTAIQAQSPLGAFTQATGDMQYAEKMNFGLASPTGAPAFNLKTPLSGVPVPPVDQVGISEAFTKGAVLVTDAFKAGAFKPDLSQTQLALLKQAFERGLK